MSARARVQVNGETHEELDVTVAAAVDVVDLMMIKKRHK